MTLLAAGLTVGALAAAAFGRWSAAVELGVVAAACASVVAVDRHRRRKAGDSRSEEGSPEGGGR